METKKQSFKERLGLFVKLVYKHFMMGDVSDSAVVLAYYALLSLFPILIILGSVARMIKGNPNAILNYIRPIMPLSIYDLLRPIIKSAFEVKHTGGSLSIGLIIVIWSASRAMAAFQRTVNRTYGVNHKQDFIMNHLASFGIMLSLVVLLIMLMLFQGFGQSLLVAIHPKLGIPISVVKLVGIVRIPFIIIVAFGLLMLLYYVVPSVKVKLKYTFLGSAVSVVGLMLLSQLFSLILNYFFKDISVYKTLGTFIVIMLWLYFIGLVLLFGAVINATVQEFREGKIKANANSSVQAIIENVRNKKTSD